MAETTAISWCDRTWSPWVGCTKVSAACDGCYAAQWAARTGHLELWDGERRRTSAAYWKRLAAWNREAIEAGRRISVFPSLCDPFDNQVPDEWREDFWREIATCDHLDFLLLTKRPQNVGKMVPGMAGNPFYRPWPNVLIGATVENQEEADRRRPHLGRIAATGTRVFVSYEPALGRVDWTGWEFICWLISGGETDQGSHKARPSAPQWHRAARDFCTANGIAYHLKQWGEWAPFVGDDGYVKSEGGFGAKVGAWVSSSGWRYLDRGEGHAEVWRVGKSRAGRLLDGREHNGFPT